MDYFSELNFAYVKKSNYANNLIVFLCVIACMVALVWLHQALSFHLFRVPTWPTKTVTFQTAQKLQPLAPGPCNQLECTITTRNKEYPNINTNLFRARGRFFFETEEKGLWVWEDKQIKTYEYWVPANGNHGKVNELSFFYYYTTWQLGSTLMEPKNRTTNSSFASDNLAAFFWG